MTPNQLKQIERYNRKRIRGLKHVQETIRINNFDYLIAILSIIRLKYKLNWQSAITLSFIISRFKTTSNGSSISLLQSAIGEQSHPVTNQAIYMRLLYLQSLGLIDLIKPAGNVNYAYPTPLVLRETYDLSQPA